MKKRIIILVAIFALTSLASSAQHKDSPVKELYEQIEDNSKLNTIYVTGKMVELRLGQKGANLNDEEVASLIENFNELILVGGEDNNLIPAEEIKKLRKIIKEKSYDQLVRMSEDGESLTVYMLEDKKSKKILDLIVLAMEEDEQMILSISGKLTMKEIGLISKLFDLDVLSLLRI